MTAGGGPGPGGGGAGVGYGYDAAGRRVERTQAGAATEQSAVDWWSGGEWQVFAAVTPAGTAWRLDGPAADSGVGSFGPGAGPGGGVWVLADRQESVVGTTPAAGGGGVSWAAYAAFGGGAAPSSAPAGWTGRPADAATGLQYNRSRWYDPASGRWASLDSLGFAAGDGNLYRYVGNAPTNATDPSGNEPPGVQEPRLQQMGERQKVKASIGRTSTIVNGQLTECQSAITEARAALTDTPVLRAYFNVADRYLSAAKATLWRGDDDKIRKLYRDNADQYRDGQNAAEAAFDAGPAVEFLRQVAIQANVESTILSVQLASVESIIVGRRREAAQVGAVVGGGSARLLERYDRVLAAVAEKRTRVDRDGAAFAVLATRLTAVKLDRGLALANNQMTVSGGVALAASREKRRSDAAFELFRDKELKDEGKTLAGELEAGFQRRADRVFDWTLKVRADDIMEFVKAGVLEAAVMVVPGVGTARSAADGDYEDATASLALDVGLVAAGCSGRLFGPAERAGMKASIPGGKVAPGAGARVFRTDVDLLKAKLGPAQASHPDEYANILRELREAKVEIDFRPGNLAYAPEKGGPGRMILDPDASIGALRHEFKHFTDIRDAKFPGFGRYMADPQEFARMEIRADMEEVKLARELGHHDVAAEIIKQMKARTNQILGK